MPSLARQASERPISRIVPTLKPGAGVVTTRNDVHFIVTEFGAADLYGKSIRQRAQALIGIAHPKKRDELRRAARALTYKGVDAYNHEKYVAKTEISMETTRSYAPESAR